MRAYAFNTLIDPFEARYGPRWAVVLSLPAMLAETFWSAELVPFKTLAAGTGLVLLPVVSRLTLRWSPPRPLRNVAETAVSDQLSAVSAEG